MACAMFVCGGIFPLSSISCTQNWSPEQLFKLSEKQLCPQFQTNGRNVIWTLKKEIRGHHLIVKCHREKMRQTKKWVRKKGRGRSNGILFFPLTATRTRNKAGGDTSVWLTTTGRSSHSHPLQNWLQTLDLACDEKLAKTWSLAANRQMSHPHIVCMHGRHDWRWIRYHQTNSIALKNVWILSLLS
jgi:hypothetical protein